MAKTRAKDKADQPTVAIVTGGNRGLGLETGRQLAALGANVVLTSRDLAQGEAAAADLREAGLSVVALPLDVTDPLSVDRLVADVDGRYGRIDILVNNAGVVLRPHDDCGTLQVNLETIRQTMEINTLAPLRLCQAVVPVMRREGHGRVVNVSSGMGQLDDMESGWPAYRISKAALSAVTRLVAREVSGANILVNAVCPGWVRTDMGGESAPRSVEQGAAGIVWAATLPDRGPSGGFFRDGVRIPW
jgi:NAD(P)-dependent dehydrogenase (short-subunit alcohol dehydrogenase family)